MKDETRLQCFSHLIADYTGLHLRPEARHKLHQQIEARMAWHRLDSAEAYYRLLRTATATSQHEWELLVRLLTVGESYFFRDRGQITFLRNRILPELIARQRATRSLRIWSAGCSTGEEPYSLAILVAELLPDRQDWHIHILGTDLNSQAIAQAQRAVFTSWSLRGLDPHQRPRYFHQHGAEWQLAEPYRTLVTFRHGNLLRDLFPAKALEIYDMDLILCRNVFIYFERDAVARVIAKFARTLRHGGYLVTAHAELHDQTMSQWRVSTFAESVVYQRRADGDTDRVRAEKTTSILGIHRMAGMSVASTAGIDRERSSIPRTTPLSHTPGAPSECAVGRPLARPELAVPPREGDVPGAPQELADSPTLREAEALLRSGAYQAVIATLTAAGTAVSCSAGSQYLLAAAYANLGQHERAVQHCQQARKLDPLAIQPYYLLAHLAEEQGDFEAAKNYLKKLLYLSPSWATAYVDLGTLYMRGRDRARARKMLLIALQLLKAMPGDAAVEPFEDMTAAQLLAEVEGLLKKN